MSNLPNKKTSIATFLNTPQTANFLEETLKDKKTEFVSNLISMCDNDANLANCEPGALMKCAMNATALNLPLNKNLGYAYIIPYKGIPSFQIGYKGILQLAIRTGSYRFLNATEIREGEIIRNKITGEIKFSGDRPENNIVGYIAYLELMSGYTASLYMTENEIEAHATKFSKMYQSDKKYSTKKSKWSDPGSRKKMALKTVLKGLLGTYGLMTTEYAKVNEYDSEDKSETFDDVEILNQAEPEIKPNNEPEKIKI